MLNQLLDSRYLVAFLVSSVLAMLMYGGLAFAQTTQFTYQGKLSDAGSPANGSYDFEFRLFDAATVGTGTQQGATLTLSGVTVANGIFSVELNFAPCATCFNGADRFLEIAVRPTSSSTYTTLSPRQRITSSPYAIKSLNAATADGLSVACVSCITSLQIASVSGSALIGAIPVASIPAGSGNYIQNTTSQQASSNFNISGNGVVGGTLGIGTSAPAGLLHVRGVDPVRIVGDTTTLSGSESVDFFARSSIFSSDLGGMRIQRQTATGNIDTMIFAASNGSSASEMLRVSGNGNVGIGTSSPSKKLEVGGNILVFPSSGNGELRVRNRTNANYAQVAFSDNADVYRGYLGYIGANAALGQRNDTVEFGTNGKDLTFRPNENELMRLTAAGNIGIGTTAPGAKLHVVGGVIADSIGINGNATANIFNSSTQYNIGGSRVLSNGGTQNLFAGVDAGTANTGSNNAFFGYFAGFANSTGSMNSFFGDRAGQSNNGNNNAFFGTLAGRANDSGTQNSFFGSNAGWANTTGGNNVFFGYFAGRNNTMGPGNAFFGNFTGLTNTTGNINTLIGFSSDVGAADLTNATAIGANARVDVSNALILGSIAGINGATADSKVGIGTTSPRSILTVRRDFPGSLGPTLTLMNGGGGAGSKVNIDFPTYDPGFNDPTARIDVIDGGNFSGYLRFLNKNPGFISNILVERMAIHPNGNVNIGGGPDPLAKLDLHGDAIIRGPLTVHGTATLIGPVNVPNLGVAGTINLCYSGDDRLIAQCSSSARYKSHVLSLNTGLELIKNLRPVTFDWKATGTHDLGLIAEEVADVEPLLVTRNSKGEIEGVKYDKVTVLLINALKEQQEEIRKMKAQLRRLRAVTASSGKRR